MLGALRSAAIFKDFKMDFSTYKRAWQSSSAAAAGALGTAHSKRVLLLGAIWQWDRTQAQTDVRGGRARG